MSFYIFRLDKLHVKRKRGNIADNDVVTFTVIVNQIDRGHGSGLFPAVVSNGVYSTQDDRTPDGFFAYPAGNRVNMSKQWAAGPFEIAPGDSVQVVYSGINTSDSELSSLTKQDQDKLQIKILGTIATAALTAGVGLIGEALATAFSALGDPIVTLLGYEPQGPCNGVVFSDAVPFSGGNLDNLAMTPPGTGLGGYPAITFTKSYTDEATHNTEICGEIALTDVTFSVLRVPFISVRHWVPLRFERTRWQRPVFLSEGLRKLGQPGTTISIKSLLGVRP